MEHFDIYLNQRLETEKIMEKLSSYIPKSLKLKKVIPIPKKEMMAMEYYNLERISVQPESEYIEAIERGLEAYNNQETWIFSRIRKGREKQQDLKEKIRQIDWENNRLTVIKERVGASIFDFLEQVCNIPRDDTDKFRIIREEMYREIS